MLPTTEKLLEKIDEVYNSIDGSGCNASGSTPAVVASSSQALSNGTPIPAVTPPSPLSELLKGFEESALEPRTTDKAAMSSSAPAAVTPTVAGPVTSGSNDVLASGVMISACKASGSTSAVVASSSQALSNGTPILAAPPILSSSSSTAAAHASRPLANPSAMTPRLTRVANKHQLFDLENNLEKSLQNAKTALSSQQVVKKAGPIKIKAWIKYWVHKAVEVDLLKVKNYASALESLQKAAKLLSLINDNTMTKMVADAAYMLCPLIPPLHTSKGPLSSLAEDLYAKLPREYEGHIRNIMQELFAERLVTSPNMVVGSFHIASSSSSSGFKSAQGSASKSGSTTSCSSSTASTITASTANGTSAAVAVSPILPSSSSTAAATYAVPTAVVATSPQSCSAQSQPIHQPQIQTTAPTVTDDNSPSSPPPSDPPLSDFPPSVQDAPAQDSSIFSPQPPPLSELLETVPMTSLLSSSASAAFFAPGGLGSNGANGSAAIKVDSRDAKATATSGQSGNEASVPPHTAPSSTAESCRV